MKEPNQKQIKEVKILARKHFINLKIKEILIVFLCIPLVIFIPYYLGLLWGDETCMTFGEIESCNLIYYWAIGFFTLILTIIAGGIIYFWIRTWLRSNWEKAYEKAEEEIGVDYTWKSYEDFKEHYK